MNVICPYCNRSAVLVTGSVIYPHRPDLVAKRFWYCATDKAWVGVHPPSKRWNPTGLKPLGRLANAELRAAKQKAHAAFDPIWKSGRMHRTEAYAWLAGEIGLAVADCHIGELDVDGCKAVVAAVERRA